MTVSTADTRHIRPAEGAAVCYEDGTPLPAAGANVVIDTWWTRRFNDGDISIAAAAASASAPAEKGNKS